VLPKGPTALQYAPRNRDRKCLFPQVYASLVIIPIAHVIEVQSGQLPCYDLSIVMTTAINRGATQSDTLKENLLQYLYQLLFV